jgi:hypothetical protein
MESPDHLVGSAVRVSGYRMPFLDLAELIYTAAALPPRTLIMTKVNLKLAA